jgi:hypothetical protein
VCPGSLQRLLPSAWAQAQAIVRRGPHATVARYLTLAAAQAIHNALMAAEAELAPLGRVRR